MVGASFTEVTVIVAVALLVEYAWVVPVTLASAYDAVAPEAVPVV
jgi:hypothetical protein